MTEHKGAVDRLSANHETSPRTKSWTGFHVESSWTVTGVSMEFDFQAECQQDMKKIEIPCGKKKSTWKLLKSPGRNPGNILLTFWHENRAEQLSMTNALIFWW